jgi:hypothetical protein
MPFRVRTPDNPLQRRRIQRRSRVSLPRLPSLPGLRQPGGYAIAEVSMRAQGFRGAASPGRQQEPAGEPPEGFPGTRPEWAIYWALEQLGYESGVDFHFEKMISHLTGAMPWSEIDFVLPLYGIGIEIQGEFWHHSVGAAKIEQDVMRMARAESAGLRVVFIDENDALADPIYFAKEALAGNDHSKNPAVRGSR